MSQSLAQIYVHIIFHTKNNHCNIRSVEFAKLYAYMYGIINKNGGHSICINGVSDHIHVVCTLPKNLPLTKLIQEIKSNSSRWLKSLDRYYAHFEWQRGYGAFSVSASILNKTKDYIMNQHKHHKKRTFREEYVLFLKEYGIEYKERFLWED